MRFSASEIANATGGRLVGDDGSVAGVAIDSRAVAGGELFVPVVAERDGHRFAAQAVDAGASAYLTSEGDVAPGCRIEVDDTGEALLRLGGHARDRLPDRVVGVTGSVGKTSVKDLTAAALATTLAVSASVRSFNNELGVPLTLANSPDDTEAVVCEMGARGRGHIRLLCGAARPTVAVVTRVAAVHTEMFGSLDEVAVAKGELVEALPPGGTAVLNADDARVAAMAALTPARTLTYSSGGAPADVTASDIRLDATLRPAFRMHTPFGDAEVALSVRGAHNVGNALAAAAAALALGVSPEAAADGLAAAVLSPWRMELTTSRSGLTVVNDAYNANPTSVEAALRSLAALPAGTRVAVLGVMAELGADSEAEHRRIAELAASLGIAVVAVDCSDYGVAPVSGVSGALDALHRLGVGAGDAVLVKGSRVAALEKVAEALLSAHPPA
ncbi:MAG TPA: UDP-N-acetylmuramoyl-tripeptide--D-alanyl-D-alanine ligase [Acidimicrobiales bacterium]|nr:UDP-N-acetylmuramoyl-tripeptide--D-alanyl-D-alanine ligase [Acidimicrobiales bacterium]